MNYSSYPCDDQSKVSKMDLLYNQKKNNRLKPPFTKPKTKKKVNFKDQQESVEHFSNPPKKESKSDNQSEIPIKEESTPIINTESESDDEEEITEEPKKSLEEEKPKSKTMLTKIISAALSLIFLLILGIGIYVAYMYFIGKKNISVITESILPSKFFSSSPLKSRRY